MTGTIYSIPLSPRSRFIVVLAKYYKLDYKVVNILNPSSDAEFAYKKVPYLIEDDFELHQTSAILQYLMAQVPKDQNEWLHSHQSVKEQCLIQQWISLFNHDFVELSGEWLLPVMGKMPYSKARVEYSIQVLNKLLGMLESRLAKAEYLVGDSISLADIYATLCLSPLLQTVLDQKWADQHPTIMSWFYQVAKHPLIIRDFTKFKIAAKPLEYRPKSKSKL